ncbi:MAG TPA: flagellar basal body-associated FliL family protein [Polyangiaceae bacterium]|nr:flagellar basal body-associated FliL family protein [Polyangiaceae bacterium]
MEAEESEESVAEPKAPKKSRLGLVLAIVAITVLVTGAAVAGTVFGPALFGHAKKGEPALEKEKGKDKEKEKIGESVELSPIMVDARAEDGNLHHLKVVLSLEVAEGTTKDELMRYMPRGREAAVGYLRSQSFDHLVDPSQYAEVRTELSKQFSEAVGGERISRVLVTDFVAQ